jgi:hypothetical protein
MRKTHAGVVSGIALICSSGCTRYIQRPPAQVDPQEYTGADGRLVKAMNQCQWTLYNSYRDVKNAQQYSDWMTFAGGAIAAAGSATTTGITAVSDSDDNAAKTTAVITGIVGAVGGIIALASKLTDGPERSTTDFVNASKHWTAAISVTDQADKTRLQPGNPHYAYAMTEFRACQSSPGAPVSPLPSGIQPLPPPPDNNGGDLAPPPTPP